MEIASGMKGLVDDIKVSRKERAKRLGEIKEEAKESRQRARGMVKDFELSRQEVGIQKRKQLARNKANRKSKVGKMRSDFRRDQKEVRNEIKEAAALWQELKSAKNKMKEV